MSQAVNDGAQHYLIHVVGVQKSSHTPTIWIIATFSKSGFGQKIISEIPIVPARVRDSVVRSPEYFDFFVNFVDNIFRSQEKEKEILRKIRKKNEKKRFL